MNLHKVIISFASAIHFIWAALLLISPSPILAVPVSPLFALFHLTPLAASIVLAGVAWLGLLGAERKADTVSLLMLLPQQTLLLLSGMAAILAVGAAHYADGVIRPRTFILADQFPTILLGPLYTCGIFSKFHLFEK